MSLELVKLRNRRSLMLVVLMIVSATWTIAMGAPSDRPATTSGALDQGAVVTSTQKDEDSLPQKAVEIGRVFGFPVTNSMLVSWIAALGLIIFAQVATRKMEQVPSGAQNFLEWPPAVFINAPLDYPRPWSNFAAE